MYNDLLNKVKEEQEKAKKEFEAILPSLSPDIRKHLANFEKRISKCVVDGDSEGIKKIQAELLNFTTKISL